MFDSIKLQRTVEDPKKMEKKFGSNCAKRLRLRLNSLRAADCVLDLVQLPGRWHQLGGDRADQWAGDLEHPFRIIIRANQELPVVGPGGVDWGEVTRVSVVEIVDYH